MAFAYVAATNTHSDTSGTSHTVNLPASIAAGDLLIILWVSGGSAPSTPSGWTLLRSDTINVFGRIFYKIASGSEGASVAITTGASTNSATNSYKIRGHDSATAPEASVAASATSTNPNPSLLDPAGWGTEDTLWIAGATGANVVASAAPAGFFGLLPSGGGGANVGMASAWFQENVASQDPGTFTQATDLWQAQTIAIRPTGIQPITGVGAIATAEAFGTIVVTPGVVAITGVGAIASAEAFGLTVVTFGFPQALTAVGAIASAEAFGTIVVVRAALPPAWPAVAEYVIEILDSGATFGPGSKLGELWDARNLGWSAYDRIPGKAFFTLSQRSSMLSLITPLTTHIRIWRLTPSLTTLVYTGAIIDYDSAGDDVVFSAYDYLALLSISRTGYRTLYPTKALGSEIVSPEWALAKGAVSSPLGFVATGTIEDPLGTDAVTVIKTNAQFVLLDQMRLQLLFDLSEIGRANTANHVTFEITRSATPTFNFLKNKGVNIDLGLTLNGNVSDYRHLPNWTSYRNDLATIGTTVGGGATEVVVKDDTAAAAKGRRQDVFTIKTLLGIVGAATTADQQRAASERMLKSALSLQPTLQLKLIRGGVDFFNGWDLGDKPIVEIGNGIDSISGRWRILGARATFDEDGEAPSLIVSPVAV